MPDILISDTPVLLSEQDLYLFNEGTNYRLYETMGSHLVSRHGVELSLIHISEPTRP